jgi:hypothetical protein
MAKFDSSEYSFLKALDGTRLVDQFGANALLIFFLSLYTRTESPEEVATEALTDGPNDKKVDACYIDIDAGRALIVQAYQAKVPGRTAAPSNKASDLNTAVAWLISAPEPEIPKGLKSKARELRDSIKNGEIDEVELNYVHNCFESDNVQAELKTAAVHCRDILRSMGIREITVSFREFGLDKIEDLFRSRDRNILVDDEIPVDGELLGDHNGDGWEAIVLTVKGTWIYDLYKTHGSRLFSANLRDYLGATRHRGNINMRIKQTAASSPTSFWVFNNGITILTKGITRTLEGVFLQGMSIINGAQTTGAIGHCNRSEVEDVRVPCRIVECDDGDLIEKIIRYNNTQNVILPSDLRSNDVVQKRLATEFEQFGVTYSHRRGTKVAKGAITAEMLAPGLSAFHGDLQTAGRRRRDIFESDLIYERLFTARFSAEHAFLIANLVAAIDEVKYRLKQRISDGKATQLESDQYEVLKFSISKFFVLFIIGQCAEEILGLKLPDLFAWKSKKQMIGPDSLDLKNAWVAALGALMPLIWNSVKNLGDPYDVVRSIELARRASSGVRSILAAAATTLAPQFHELKSATVA